MKRLTTDAPVGNFETMLNFVYGKDGWAYIRHDGEHENVRLTDWAKRQCLLHGCGETFTETPEEIDWRLCDCMMDGPICPIAMAYCFASQAVHLRSRLAAYEDTGLGPEEVKEHEAAYIEIMTRTYGPLHQKIDKWLQAEKDGRLVVLEPAAKEGEKKPPCFYSDMGQDLCLGFARGECDDEPVDRCKECWYCESTREEAEAALKKREAHEHEGV